MKTDIKQMLLNILSVAVILTCVPALAAIEINDINELQLIGNDPGYPLDGDYTLGNDIDATVTATWNGGKGFKPIAPDTDYGTEFYQGTAFTGSFDGVGFTIEGLYINRPNEDFVGLFGYTSGAYIEKIVLENTNIKGRVGTGALIGVALDYTIISKCFSRGQVTGAGDFAGGLVGGLENSYMYNCRSSGIVTGVRRVGGLVGTIDGGEVKQCDSASAVTGVSTCGGFAGRIALANDTTVSNCYCYGSVTGDSYVGGFVGMNGIIYNSAIVTNCYSRGNVVGNSDIGGFSGVSTNSTVTRCYWDKEVSGQTTSAAGTGKTTAEMMEESTYVGWDFTNIWYNDNSRAYPYLRSIPTRDTWTPHFSPVPGTYSSEAIVTITSSTANIRYTLDGTTPTPSSPQYSSPIIINSTKTLKAKAWGNLMFPSGVASGTYTINEGGVEGEGEQLFSLTVNSLGASNVLISSETGHGGNTNYTKTIKIGTTVKLSAPKTSGEETFSGWSGSANTIGVQTVTFVMDSDETVTAIYYRRPPAPINVAATLGDYDDKIRITWDAVPGAVQYQVVRKSSLEESLWTRLGEVDNPPYDDFTIARFKNYYYAVHTRTEIERYEGMYPDKPWIIQSDLSSFVIGSAGVIEDDDRDDDDDGDDGEPVPTSPSLSVSPGNRSVSYGSGFTTFDVSNSGDGTMKWNATVTSGNWLRINSGASGSNSGQINVSYDYNSSTRSRSGEIKITASGATGSPKIISITQDEEPYIPPPPPPGCKCFKSSFTNPIDEFKELLVDWLLVGLSMLVLFSLTTFRKKK